MKYEELNNKYYALFSDLFASRAVLPPKQYNQMSDALSAEYKRELELLVGTIQLETGREMFELKWKLGNMLPRRFLFWRNKVAKAVIKSCREQFERYLKELETAAKKEDSPLPSPPTTALTVVETAVTEQRNE